MTPFRTFRVIDTKENAIIPHLLLTDGDGGLYFTEAGMLTEIAPDDSLSVQYATPFADMEGTPIWQGDSLHIPHRGQVSATSKPEGRDLLVDWDATHGQWALYSFDAGFKMMVSPLWAYTKKGTVVHEPAKN